MEYINWITANWQQLLLIATSLVTLCALIAALTPTPKDDAAVAWVRKWIDRFAINVGHAKNAPKAPEKE